MSSFELRYGDVATAPIARSAAIDLMLAHRSVRRFTATEVGDAELRALVAAAQSAPTSSNLQPWSVLAVRDADLRNRLAGLAGDQDFIRQAPLFLVWIADLDRARRLGLREGRCVEAVDYLDTTLIGFVDAALAAQNAATAAESLGLGATFVGAVRNRPREFAAALGLPPHAVATFGLAVGHPDPAEDAGVKPRLPQAAVLHVDRYDAAQADAHVPAYDARLSAYNEKHGLDGTWTDRVLTRLSGPAAMSGRHLLRHTLERIGLPSR